MERKYRLKLNADFQRVRREGKVWMNDLMVLCALPNNLELSRFGFAVSRRIGKAVVRNQIKRRMREAVRLRQSVIPGGWDLVFIARSAITERTYADIARAIENLLRRANLTLNSENTSR